MGLRANLRALRLLYGRQRERGHGALASLLWQMPLAAGWRAYRKLAYAVNDGPLQRLTAARFTRFQAGLALRDGEPAGGRFYVIVMPRTLHFLLPCLGLIARDVRVVLLLNGAQHWEAGLLRARWPTLPQFRVSTLPASSVAHGAMINLLLRHNERDFGLIDHDLYLFDRSVFARLQLAEDQLLLCLLADSNPDERMPWVYPLTHFLYFRAAAFRSVMARYGSGAQIYRRLPAAAAARLAAAGLGGIAVKGHHDFYDTLQVLIALGHADGLGVTQLELADEGDLFHIGGTSIGTHRTKELLQLYFHLRMLELSGEPLLQRRYAALAAPFKSAEALRERLPPTSQNHAALDAFDRLVERLKEA